MKKQKFYEIIQGKRRGIKLSCEIDNNNDEKGKTDPQIRKGQVNEGNCWKHL